MIKFYFIISLNYLHNDKTHKVELKGKLVSKVQRP